MSDSTMQDRQEVCEGQLFGVGIGDVDGLEAAQEALATVDPVGVRRLAPTVEGDDETRDMGTSAVVSGPVVIGYVRVSTDEQAASGLGLEAQRRAIVDEASRRGWPAPVIVDDLGVSGSVAPGKREGMSEALRLAYKAASSPNGSVFIVAKLDRATRSVGDLCGLLELLERRKVTFVAMDLGVDTTTPMGSAMAKISGTFAELERKLIGERTRAALAERKASGQRLGGRVRVDAAVRDRARELLEAGASFAEAARVLNAEGATTATGRPWGRQHVRTLAASLRVDDEMAALAG